MIYFKYQGRFGTLRGSGSRQNILIQRSFFIREGTLSLCQLFVFFFPGNLSIWSNRWPTTRGRDHGKWEKEAANPPWQQQVRKAMGGGAARGGEGGSENSGNGVNTGSENRCTDPSSTRCIVNGQPLPCEGCFHWPVCLCHRGDPSSHQASLLDFILLRQMVNMLNWQAQAPSQTGRLKWINPE